MALSVQIEKRLGSFCLSAAFTAEPGEILALLGPSGCGKSMTLKCIAGIQRPDQGRIVLDGRGLFDKAAGIDLPPQARGIGYLFQQYALFPHMTVAQNIQAGARRQKKAGKQVPLQELLALLRLEGLENRRPAQLSGGQQQRVAIARALATKPAIILADEPTGNLDSKTSLDVLGLLKVTSEKFGQTIVMITHNEELAQMAQRIIRIEDGRIAGDRNV